MAEAQPIKLSFQTNATSTLEEVDKAKPALLALDCNKTKEITAIDLTSTKSANEQKKTQQSDNTHVAWKKPRNPIIVMQRIHAVVSELLKNLFDTQKEINTFKKKEWSYYSQTHANTYLEGTSAQKYVFLAKGIKVFSDVMLACMTDGQLDPNHVSMLNAQTVAFINAHLGYLARETGVKVVGSVADTLGNAILPQKQMEIQAEEAKMSCKIGCTSSDYQNGSQEESSEEQMLENMTQRHAEGARIAAQMLTGQAV